MIARLKQIAPVNMATLITVRPMPNIIGSAGWIFTRPTDGIYQKKNPAIKIINAQKERRPKNIPLADR